jgi:hypothetical protein
MSLEYYANKEEGARVKALNLRVEYEAQEYHPPFQIMVCQSKEYGQFYKVQDSWGKVICDTWRQGVDAERIVEALNLTYELKKSNLVDVLSSIFHVMGIKDKVKKVETVDDPEGYRDRAWSNL